VGSASMSLLDGLDQHRQSKPGLVINPDTSMEVCFGPTAPAGSPGQLGANRSRKRPGELELVTSTQ
jgi:hypothetical protein